MTWQWLVLGGLALVALGLLVAFLRLRAAATRQVAGAVEQTRQLQERLDRLEHEMTRPVPPAARDDRIEQEYRITRLGQAGRPEQPSEPARLEHAVFADLVLRESVIRLGSLTHGVRRALSAESRNRIRFEMKREVRRARKHRRAEQREAYREWQARQRDVA